MVSLPKALSLSFAQLGDRAILRVLGKSMVVTLAILAVLLLGLYQAMGWFAARYASEHSGLGLLLTIVIGAVGVWLLYRIVALAVIQFFADEVVEAVEQKHFPEAAAHVRKLGFREEAANGLRGALRALLVNLAALPFALLLLATGIGTVLLFWAVNAWLLGRELQDIVWLRHRASPADPAPLSSATRFALGGAVAGLLLVPFINLLAPILGAAAATHLVHGRRG